MKQRKLIRYLLLDLDGTLIRSSEHCVKVDFLIHFSRWWKKYTTLPKILQGVRQIDRAMRAPEDGGSLRKRNHERAILAFASATGLDAINVEPWLEESLHSVFPELKRFFGPLSGASEFVSWAKARYPLILATNPVWTPEIVEMRLNWGGLSLNSFRSLTHAKRMSYCKPHVAYYEELLRQEQLDPAECLLIGNDLDKDGPAVFAGISVCILSRKKELVEIKKKGVPPGLLFTGNYDALRHYLSENQA